MPPINTQRLILREFHRSDLDGLFALYSLPETSEFESWGPHTSPVETQGLLDHWMARQSDQPRTDFTLAVELGDEFIGLCGIELGFGTETDDLRAGFVGYRIHPAHWNCGYATEALKAILAYGFDELLLHRIHSGCAATNIASLKVLEKAGLRREGTTRESFPVSGGWVDYVIFGILDSEWRHTT